MNAVATSRGCAPLTRARLPCRAHVRSCPVGWTPLAQQRGGLRAEGLVCFASEPTEPAAEPAAAPAVAAAAEPADAKPETTFYEGSGAPAELVISLLLGATVLYLPLTLASIGRRLWIRYKFTNKRLIITTNSPVFKREVQVEYSKIKEIRTAPRAFGLWGDMVIFLKDGSRLELAGLERFQEIRDYIYGHMVL